MHEATRTSCGGRSLHAHRCAKATNVRGVAPHRILLSPKPSRTKPPSPNRARPKRAPTLNAPPERPRGGASPPPLVRGRFPERLALHTKATRPARRPPTHRDCTTPQRSPQTPPHILRSSSPPGSPAFRRKPESELSASRHRCGDFVLPSQRSHTGAHQPALSMGMPARHRRRCEAPPVYNQSIHINITINGRSASRPRRHDAEPNNASRATSRPAPSRTREGIADARRPSDAALALH